MNGKIKSLLTEFNCFNCGIEGCFGKISLLNSRGLVCGLWEEKKECAHIWTIYSLETISDDCNVYRLSLKCTKCGKIRSFVEEE